MNKKPNVILITIDSLRADHLGFMGYKKNTSPNIDALAKESVVFTNAFSNGPVTLHSFPSIITSTYPLDYQGPRKIERPRVLISEILQKNGYITALFSSNAYLSDFFGYNRGWDFFEDINPLRETTINDDIKDNLTRSIKEVAFTFFPQFYFWIKYLQYRNTGVKNGRSGPNFWGNRVTASYLNQIVKDFIVGIEKEKKPFFVWIHYMDVHSPYFPLSFYLNDKPLSFQELMASGLTGWFAAYPQKKIFKKFAERNIEQSRNLYDSAIKYTDLEIGNLLNFLKKEKVYENSIIFLTADHGDEFLEHGGGGHSAKLYNELLHIPLIAKIPQFEPRKIKTKVSLIDLTPTICDVLKIRRCPSFKGENLLKRSDSPIFHQTGHKKTKDGKNITFAEVDNISQCKIACQTVDWKYILDHGNNQEELYNLSEDPREKKTLAFEESSVLLKMRKMIQEFENKNPPLSLINKDS